MASTYTNSLRLELIASGEAAATWGDKTNVNLTNIASAFGYATQDGFGANADSTTTVADGAADPARAMYFKVTSSATLTATRTLTIAPNTISRVMWIENATTGGQSIAISQGTGANVTIANGKTAVVYLDGAGSGAAVVDAMAGVSSGASDTLAEILAAGNTTGGTDIAVGTGDDITFADNSKAIFGAGSDLQIYHDGSASYIDDAGTGNLRIRANSSLSIQKYTGETMGVFTADGSVLLAHDNVTKFETTSTGIDVTGSVTADGLTVNSSNNSGNTGTPTIVLKDLDVTVSAGQFTGAVEFETSDTNNPGVNSYIRSVMTGTGAGGSLKFGTGFAGSLADRVLIGDNGDISFYDDAAAQGLFWDSSESRLGLGTTSPNNRIDAVEAQGTVANVLANGTYVAKFTGNTTYTTGASQGILIGGVDGSLRGVALVAEAQSALNDHDFIIAVSGTSATPTERMRIDSVGTTTIKTDGTTQLVLNRADASIQSGNQIANLLITGDDPSAGQSGAAIAFTAGDAWATNSYPTNIVFYNDNSGTLTSRMTLDKDGNLLVGTTSAFGTTGTTINAAGLVYSSADGDRSGQFDRTGVSDGEIVRFTKAGTTVGSIGSRSGVVSYIVLDPRSGVKGAALIGGSVDANNGIINPGKADGDIADDAISLGSSSSRFKDLYLSGGAYLGGTAAANKLEDYEEGTWTPTLYYQNATGVTRTYTEQTGYYTKIGNTVTVWCTLRGATSNSGSYANDNMGISGLPFSVITAATMPARQSGFAGTASVGTLYMQISSSTALLITPTNVNNLGDDLGAGATYSLTFSGSYNTTA